MPHPPPEERRRVRPRRAKEEADLLIINGDKGCEARYLAFFGSMTVAGRATNRASLSDGDTVEAKGLKVTYVADIN